MVGSKLIDRVMGMITKGELARATATWKQAHFHAVVSGSLQLHHRSARGDGDPTKRAAPLPLQALPCLRNSLWTMSRGMSASHGGSPFPCLGLSTYMAIQMSKGFACWSKCLLSQHVALSCPLPWF